MSNQKQETDLLKEQVKSLTDKLDSLLPTSVTNNTINATQNEGHGQLSISISQSKGNNHVEPTRLS